MFKKSIAALVFSGLVALRCVPLAAALLALTAAEVSADIMTFTHEGTGGGTLNGDAFSASDFVITATGNTTDRDSFANGWWINHTSASISIDGVGDLDFLSSTRTFVNNNLQLVGFSRGPNGSDLFNGPTDAQFGTWDMLGPIGPISGEAQLLQWSLFPQIDTTGGILMFNNGTSRATFTATIIPAPASTTLGLIGLAAAAVLRRRRT